MQDLLFKIGLILVILIVLGSIALTVYCFIAYGNTPIKDCPSWVVWFMRKS